MTSSSINGGGRRSQHLSFSRRFEYTEIAAADWERRLPAGFSAASSETTRVHLIEIDLAQQLNFATSFSSIRYKLGAWGEQGGITMASNSDQNDENYIQLDQFLKLNGLTQSGGEAKFLIQDGQVKVNGVVETRRKKKLRDGDKIEAFGKVLIVKRTE